VQREEEEEEVVRSDFDVAHMRITNSMNAT
jgi:hypothetical protein